MASSSLRPTLRVIGTLGTCNPGLLRTRASQSFRFYSQKATSPPANALPSTSASRIVKKQSSRISDSAWPWRPIQRPKSSTYPPTAIFEERTVFTRPLAHSPRLLLGQGFAALLIGSILCYMPDKPMLDDWWMVNDDEEMSLKLAAGTVVNIFVYKICPAVAAIAWIVTTSRVWTGARRITRLSQIRVRQTDSKVPATTFLRMHTGWHALLGKHVPPREFKATDAALTPVTAHGQQAICLSISPAKRRFNLVERKPYFMDFRLEGNLEGKEVVTSAARLETVFGRPLSQN
ncbi:hypothetical protein IAT38_000280 [Cryptococcus sp. DSM 104549]